jgi:hypothetical protein
MVQWAAVERAKLSPAGASASGQSRPLGYFLAFAGAAGTPFWLGCEAFCFGG